jgi:uncharacterized OB-fold protein
MSIPEHCPYCQVKLLEDADTDATSDGRYFSRAEAILTENKIVMIKCPDCGHLWEY